LQEFKEFEEFKEFKEFKGANALLLIPEDLVLNETRPAMSPETGLWMKC
jgi:hypothetical protein